MKTFYHATHHSRMRSVLRGGLLPSTEHIGRKIRPGVYLTDDPFWAAMFGEIVLEVEIPNRSLLYRPKWGSYSEYLYRGFIPPEYIRFYGRGEEILEEEEKKEDSRVKFI